MTHPNSPIPVSGPSWPFPTLYAGHVREDQQGKWTFIFWHKAPNHLLQLTGRIILLNPGHLPVIEELKLGQQWARRGGVPHWGYLFTWHPPKNEYPWTFYLEVYENLMSWLNRSEEISDFELKFERVDVEAEMRKAEQEPIRRVSYLRTDNPALTPADWTHYDQSEEPREQMEARVRKAHEAEPNPDRDAALEKNKRFIMVEDSDVDREPIEPSERWRPIQKSKDDRESNQDVDPNQG